MGQAIAAAAFCGILALGFGLLILEVREARRAILAALQLGPIPSREGRLRDALDSLREEG